MRSLKNLRIIIVLFDLIFIWWLYFENTINYSNRDNIAAAIIIHSCALFVSLSYFKYLKLPFVSVLALLNIFGFGVAPANVDFAVFQLGVFNPETYSVVNLGYVVFYFCHFFFLKYLIKNFIINTRSEVLDFDKSIRFRYLVILQNYCLFFFVTSKILTLPISGLNEFIESFTIGSLMIGFLRGINSWFKNLLTIFILIFTLAQILVSGLIYPLIFFGIFIVALIYLYGISSFLSKLIISAGALFGLLFSVLFNPVKMEYRLIDFSDNNNVYDRALVIKELISTSNTPSSTNEENDKSVFWRITYPMSAISLVREKTPLTVPYWNGESYFNLLYKFIPRFIWKDKPKEEMGQLFGHRYNILNERNYTTSMNTPIIAEAYMNFGVIGFYGMFILMSFILARSFISSNIKVRIETNSLNILLNDLNVAIVLTFLIQWESNFSMVFGKIIILFIVNKLIESFAFRRR